ncbi:MULTISPECIES: biopolymer transporter ExbD [unclassified Synechocystis]|uniref:ExbD/TolR family protein n=1 Tax=unclassified Synechocystis TaxID=2640012 RepID=UPI00041F95C9|nr:MULTISPECIES: biopolymer transporter ExbD [unclassified Synechocystis]AIE73436.1 Biopolymer transport protein ExbD/TolR [Synechocystis sp. PCC 6714]
MRLPDEAESQGEINIIPMIDVIFSILAFFIISSLYLSRSDGLSVNLPSAQTTESKPNPQFILTVKQSGELFLDGRSIPIENLGTSILTKAKSNANSLVVIKADEQANHGLVVQVMDEVRQIKGVSLAIATTPKN